MKKEYVKKMLYAHDTPRKTYCKCGHYKRLHKDGTCKVINCNCTKEEEQ